MKLHETLQKLFEESIEEVTATQYQRAMLKSPGLKKLVKSPKGEKDRAWALKVRERTKEALKNEKVTNVTDK